MSRGTAIAVGPSVARPVVAENDLSFGSPVFISQAHARARHDCVTCRPGFVDAVAGHVRRADGGLVDGAFGRTG